MNKNNAISVEEMDQEVVLEFLDESTDGIETASTLLVNLESTPDDLALINSIFRPVHSLKGNSGFFGLKKVKTLSHEMENLLDMMRREQLRINSSVIEVLLEGTDTLREMLSRVRDSEPEIKNEDKFQALITKLQKISENRGEADELWGQLIEKLDKIMIRLDKADKTLVSDLESVISAIKSATAKNGSKKKTTTDSIDQRDNSPQSKLLQMLAREQEGTFSEEDSDKALSLLEELRDTPSDKEAQNEIEEAIRIWHVFMNSAVGFDNLCRQSLLEKVKPLIDRDAWRSTTDKPASAAAPEDSRVNDKNRPQAESHKTMRINEESIDQFLAYVGELIVIGDMFKNLQKQMDNLNSSQALTRRFRQVNETFSSLSDNLRKSIMNIRKVPMRILIQKAPRMIRDISKDKGKDIEISTEGEGIEVDKSLADLLDAPLTHMIRNAADHGIEMPEERRKANKTSQGHINITVRETDATIALAVKDDGAGLNYKAIQSKAESMGLIKAGEKLSEKQIVDFLFASGVSTAEKVTDISGRGVGMDVVKRMIEEGGGSISVSSTPGKGSEFTITMPKSVTTQIMDAFLVNVNSQPFALPMNNVLEASELDIDKTTTVQGQGRCVKRHNKLYPLYFLENVLGIPQNSGLSDKNGIVITLTTSSKNFAVVVDEVLGVQQIVLRQIEGMHDNIDIISGGALMGDNNVALVLDVEELVKEPESLT